MESQLTVSQQYLCEVLIAYLNREKLWSNNSEADAREVQTIPVLKWLIPRFFRRQYYLRLSSKVVDRADMVSLDDFLS